MNPRRRYRLYRSLAKYGWWKALFYMAPPRVYEMLEANYKKGKTP